MARYSKDEDLKFQVKFLHDNYGFSIPLIAALQGGSRRMAHLRYESITNEIAIYDETRNRYAQYVSDIAKCKGVAAITLRLQSPSHNYQSSRVPK